MGVGGPRVDALLLRRRMSLVDLNESTANGIIHSSLWSNSTHSTCSTFNNTMEAANGTTLVPTLLCVQGCRYLLNVLRHLRYTYGSSAQIPEV